jgi:DNA-binding MarR family transcriptional regulator
LETKIIILRCLSNGDWWPTSQVALACGLSLTNASELLRRYRRQGLVNREPDPTVPRGYLYHITEIGLERLEYLSS